MKTRALLLIAAIAMLAGPAIAEDQPAMPGLAAADATNPATQAYLKAMDTMHRAMQAMKPRNDASMDFVMMMKPHHQAAVDMAQAYLKSGKDPELLKLARDIVASQTKEIGLMNDWEAKHKM